MTTLKEKKYVVNHYLMKWINNKDTSYLTDVLSEISTSDQMNALVENIDTGKGAVCEKIMDVLDNESSEIVDALYDFVKLL